MMKRAVKLLGMIILGMICSCGCGAGNPENNVPVTPEIIVEETVTPEIIVEESVTLVETKEEEKLPLAVQINVVDETFYSEEANKNYFFLNYSDVTVEGTGFENVKQNVEGWSKERQKQIQDKIGEMLGAAETEIEDNSGYYAGDLRQTVKTARADKQIISLWEEEYRYFGPENRFSDVKGVNFDAVSGKQLILSDVINDYENFKLKATNRIVSELETHYEGQMPTGYKENVEKLWQDGREPDWYFDAAGLVIILQEYSVGPYDRVRPEICLSYAEFKHFLKGEYIPEFKDGVMRLEENRQTKLPAKGVSDLQPLILSCEWIEEMPYTSLKLGEDALVISDFAFLVDAYIICNGEDIFCLIGLDMASEDYVTYIYRLTEGVIQPVGEIGAAIDAGNINENGGILQEWMDVLGTHRASKYYTFDAEKGFCTDDEEFLLKKDVALLTTTKDLEVFLDGKENILPAGSRILLTATDGETYVKFVVEGTGQSGKLRISRNPEEYYRVLVNGMDENECFESLHYSG